MLSRSYNYFTKEILTFVSFFTREGVILDFFFKYCEFVKLQHIPNLRVAKILICEITACILWQKRAIFIHKIINLLKTWNAKIEITDFHRS